MPIRFRCPHCQQLMGIARRKAGQAVQCPTCKATVTVPAEDVPDAPAPAAAAGGGQDLFERSDFDALLQGEGAATHEGEAAPKGAPPPVKAPAPRPAPAAARQAPAKAVPPPVRSGSGFDVEPMSGLMPQEPPALVLTSRQLTWAAVVAVLAAALAFAGGVLVGRFVL
jgi:hypothetical protein